MSAEALKHATGEALITGLGLYLAYVALSQWLRGGPLYDGNHCSMACWIGRKDVASSHWFHIAMSPIICSIGFF